MDVGAWLASTREGCVAKYPVSLCTYVSLLSVMERGMCKEKLFLACDTHVQYTYSDLIKFVQRVCTLQPAWIFPPLSWDETIWGTEGTCNVS